jgi:hypothetical protein
MNRHAGNHKAWQPTAASSAHFKNLPGTGWYVFVAELLHSKGPMIKDTNYVHDVLVADGKLLLGKTYAERHAILCSLFGVTDQTPMGGDVKNFPSHFVVNPGTVKSGTINGALWIARIFRQEEVDPVELYKAIDACKTNPLDEGVVLKDLNAKLNLCSKAASNNAGQVKIRRSHKNYGF